MIYEEFQPVRVSDNMIFINEDKKVKVWLSPNLLDNTVRTSYTVTQEMMVADIFSIFQKFSSSCADFPAKLGFVEALDYLEKKKSNQSIQVRRVNMVPKPSIGGQVPPYVNYVEKPTRTVKIYSNQMQNSSTNVTSPKRPNLHNLNNLSANQYEIENRNKKSSMISTRSNKQVGAKEPELAYEEGHMQSITDKLSYVPNFDNSREDED